MVRVHDTAPSWPPTASRHGHRVYPGDGYGAVNIDRRQEILLPAGAPSPSALTQIVASGDITGDGRTDFLATVGDELWAFTGYHGATVDQAVLLSGGWTNRDLVTVMDVSGDGVADMVYRTDSSGRLLLRKGIAASGGGTNLNSLASAANSSGGTDTEYGASGWYTTDVPLQDRAVGLRHPGHQPEHLLAEAALHRMTSPGSASRAGVRSPEPSGRVSGGLRGRHPTPS
jgi:hypothetical protein